LVLDAPIDGKARVRLRKSSKEVRLVVIHPADGLIHRLLRQSGQSSASENRAPFAKAPRDTVNISGQARARMMDAGDPAAPREAGARPDVGQVDRLGEQLLQIYRRNGRAG